MKTLVAVIIVSLLCLGTKPENCNETVEILKQRIQVQQITNNTQKEMIRKRDSIIYVQDSLIVKLQSR
ncbi:hypothetical protein M1M30_gp171 [Maribacter phage Colly_1]|uniref:Uncharacterized protein n=1 Tax=Maribacter phage Colly_1 TaxID=2745691 RepID=A0A8E4XZQ8_9CAUD|nr:hypothetical protein M1M30_gp171 [Maribacter phage Colly_1]QQO97275.1 hypothetical protein Colly1_171 [Maribacter phage Colly_1]